MFVRTVPVTLEYQIKKTEKKNKIDSNMVQVKRGKMMR